ncbi:hypothetical protein [Imbroritus primus]|uniref:hypothetical protein n=1 Tax=Imbroritus primus TaxID=3058603 RepID=UPI003D161B91
MKEKENVFGLNAGVLAEVRARLERATKISLTARDSLYFGGEYFRYSDEKLSVLLHENFIEDDGKPTAADFPEVAVLLYVSGEVSAVDQLSEKVLQQGFRLLYSGTH